VPKESGGASGVYCGAEGGTMKQLASRSRAVSAQGLRQVVQMMGAKTGRGVGADGCRWIVLWSRGRHNEAAC